MSRLPGAEEAYVEEAKILRHLLKTDHKEGGPKARFFAARGFSPASWQLFADALVSHGQRHEVARVKPTAFGALYEIRCTLVTPDGQDPCIRTVWEVRVASRPRLVTAYPFD